MSRKFTQSPVAWAARTILNSDEGKGTALIPSFDAGGFWIGNTQEEINQEAGARVAQLESNVAYRNVVAYGATGDGVTNDWVAFANARTDAGASGIVHFPTGREYLLVPPGGIRVDISGCYILVDEGAALKGQFDPNVKTAKLVRATRFIDTVHLTDLVKPANIFQSPEMYNLAAALSEPNLSLTVETDSFSTWQHKIYNTATGDISAVNGTGTVAATQVTWAAAFVGNPQIVYPSLALPAPGTMYEINIQAGTGANAAGVFAKASDGGVWRITCAVGSANVGIFKTNTSGVSTISLAKALPNGGAYGLIASRQLSAGFAVMPDNRVAVIFNGLPIYIIPDVVTTAGFVVGNNPASNEIILRTPLKFTNYKARIKRPLNIAVIGDSTLYGAWSTIAIESMLPAALQNMPEIGDVTITNLAVSSTASSNWVTTTATGDYSEFDIVLVMLGTNDQQGLVSPASYIANMTTIHTNITVTCPNVIYGVYPIWTRADISGVTGVAAVNYAFSGEYVHALWNWIATNGHDFADVRTHFGANIKWYGDNIHETSEGLVAYVAAFVEGIRRHMARRGYLV